MRKIGVLFVFIYVFNNILSQDKISISFSTSPIISNSILKSIKDTTYYFHQTSSSYINGRNKADKSLVGFKSGLNIIYNFSDKFSCFTGFNYIFQRIMQSTILIVGEYYFGETKYYIYGDKYYTLNAKYQYLSTPIGMNISVFSMNKINLGLSSSFAFDYLINSNSIVNKTPDNTNYSRDYAFTYEYNLGIICDFRIHDDLKVFIKPCFNIFIKPNLIEYNSIKQYNYYYNFEVGLKYKINSH